MPVHTRMPKFTLQGKLKATKARKAASSRLATALPQAGHQAYLVSASAICSKSMTCAMPRMRRIMTAPAKPSTSGSSSAKKPA